MQFHGSASKAAGRVCQGFDMSLMVLCSFTAFSHSLPLISSVTMVCTVPSSRQWGAIPEERVHRNLLFIKCGRCLLHSMAGASQGIVNATAVAEKPG